MQTRVRLLILATSLVSSAACDDKGTAESKAGADAKAGPDAKSEPDAKAGADAKAGDDGKAGPDAKAGDDAKAEPPAGDGEADVKITGALETTLTGKIVSCGATHIEGRVQGGSWGIRTDALDLQILALTDEELDDPKLIVNVKKPERKSYVLASGGKLTTAKDRTVAEIDTDMRNIVAKDDRIHVTGTMTCPPK